MISFFRWVCGFIVIVLFAGFAALNRQSVSFIYSPLHDGIEMPLFIILLGFSGLGFLIGAFVVWFNDGKLRREKRLQKKQIKNLETELKKSQNVMTVQNQLHDPLFTALPKN